jgi:excisionase family DNA binding protein
MDPANVDWVESPTDRPGPRARVGSIDVAIRDAVRDVVREVVRDEVRRVLREELANLTTQPSANDGGYLSIAEAANFAKVHEATIRAWIGKGSLRGFRAGRHHRVHRSDLDRFLASNSAGGDVDLDARASRLAAA